MLLENKNILIVGGAGFVGSNLCKRLLNKTEHAKIYVVDNLLSSDLINVPEDDRLTFIYGSIADYKILNTLPNDINFIFHLACYHGNQSSIANPEEDHDNNLHTTLRLLEHSLKFQNLEKFVYAAAGCAVAEKTYDDAVATPEDAPVSLFQDSPYSISKLVGEMYGNYYFKQKNIPFVKARFQNVYGPNEILGAGQWRGTVHTVWRNVIPSFIWKSLNQEALPLDNGGLVSRDFIFVEDLVRGLMAIAEGGNPGEAYNLASGRETTILELANIINELTKNPTPVELKPARTWDNSGRRFGDTQKSKKDLSFEAVVSIADGLKKTIEWTKENKSIIYNCINKHGLMIKQIDKNN